MNYPNELSSALSPYLRQHGENPVAWRTWSGAALETAKRQDKPLLISIGYAACHWCHVMAHESFEDEETARIMNTSFVPIKVDREERPDIDGVYMTAVQIISGRGGWPLHCFAFPDGRPFFGGTYFPPAQWRSVLTQIAELWENDRPRLEAAAEDITKGVISEEYLGLAAQPAQEARAGTAAFSIDAAKDSYYKASSSFDTLNGNLQGSPKFPVPGRLSAFLEFAAFTHNKEALHHVELSLKKMAEGGIYDHLGGGFSRYSVDSEWKVPHFEKMLYDNAQLIEVYAKANLLLSGNFYTDVAGKTHSFLLRDLKSPEGGFYSSLDADSEGEEGKYYVWTFDEISQIAGKDAALFCSRYGILPGGNWEDGKNILHAAKSIQEASAEFGLTEEAAEKRISRAEALLFTARSERAAPALDDKVLLSWNALLLKACTWAHLSFGDPAYLETALRIAQFVQEHLMTADGSLFSVWSRGRAAVPAFTSDYALLADALIDLYETVFDLRHIRTAEKLADRILEDFRDIESGLLHFSAKKKPHEEPDLFAQRIELVDNVLPSSNAVAADVFLRLGHHAKREDFLLQGRAMARIMQKRAAEDFSNYYRWMSVLMKDAAGIVEITAKGGDAAEAAEILSAVKKSLLPEAVFSLEEAAARPGKFSIIVCKDKVCARPAATSAEVLQAVRELRGQ